MHSEVSEFLVDLPFSSAIAYQRMSPSVQFSRTCGTYTTTTTTTTSNINGPTRKGDNFETNGNYEDATKTIIADNSDERRLVDIVQVPTHLRFNGYIHSGYRPVMSAGCCAKSLGHFHNETLNIITHGLPFLYIVFNASNLLPWDEITVPLLPQIHILAITAPWLGSSIYHLFMNTKGDEVIYKRLLQVDMIGIWITQSLGPIPTIILTIYCLPVSIQLFVIALYLWLSAVSLYNVLMADTPWRRRSSFLWQYLVRMCLHLVRASFASSDVRDTRTLILQEILVAIGAAVGATFVPERFFPGKLDYLGNSHQIMHIIMVISMSLFHDRTSLDLVWLSKGESQCFR